MIHLSEDLLQKLATTIPLPVLRLAVSRSKFWRDKVFKGFRPGVLTNKQLRSALQKPAVRREAQVEKDLPDWWRSAYADLLSELNQPDYRDRVRGLTEKWPATVVAVALELAGRQDAASLVPVLSEVVEPVLPNRVTDRRIAARPAVDSQGPEAVDVARLARQVKGLEKRIQQAGADKRRLESELLKAAEEHRKLDRKIQELSERLRTGEKELKAQQAANVREILETGTVVIYYDQIGTSARERLLALAELRSLLAAPAGEAPEVSGVILGLAARGSWAPYWDVERRTGRLAVKRQPDDHVLVGTVLLLEDLTDVQDLFA